MGRPPIRVFSTALFVLIAVCASAQTRAKRPAVQAPPPGKVVVADYGSAHFLIHTDLPKKDAQELLKRLEVMLKLVAGYWNRPASGIIECYVAKDLAAWPDEITSKLPEMGIMKIKEGAGVCIAQKMTLGNQFIAKAVVFAVANVGVPQHEAVHAYCQHTFGRTGPQWYAEGMAEVGQYWVEGERGVNAHPTAIRFLLENPPQSIDELIVTKETTGGTWQDYARWWSLCHFLEHNGNYSAKFRQLGVALLLGAPNEGFAQTFGPVAKELSFEYFFFMRHLQKGFRVDLTTWDWKRKFRPFGSKTDSLTVTIQAGRGWQPTGLTVAAGSEYEFSTTGTWTPVKGEPAIDANGRPDGVGRLTGALLNDYKLSQEIPLAKEGSFKAVADGQLYLRCKIPWPQLGDASGKITIKLKPK